MSSPFIQTRLNVFEPLAPVAWRAVRVSVGGSREGNGERFVLLCLWKYRGGILAELALAEHEYRALVDDLIEAAPRTDLEAEEVAPWSLL